MAFHAITTLIDTVVDRIGRSAAWLTLAMVLLMALIVIMRYLFRTGSIAMQELVMYFNALIFTLGAAYTLKEQGHVRVDIFYRKLSQQQQALIDCLGYVFFLFPCVFFIAYSSWDYVAVSWRIKESSPETSGLAYVYLLKSTIILLCLLLFLQGVSELLKSIGKLRPSSR